MGFENDWSSTVMGSLGEQFTLGELEAAMRRAAKGVDPLPREAQRTVECVRWLAESNYEIHFDPSVAVSERIIFPVSSNESNGMEDARFVRFVDDDGSVLYYATYTAYNGRAILPQLLETSDFLSFRALTLNGRAVQNKGMAFFPRRIDGRYAMISRQDDENLFLMFSDNPHFWSDPQLLRRPCPSVGSGKNRQLRLAYRNGSGLAGNHAWRGPDAQILHRRAAARFARPVQGAGGTARASAAGPGQRTRRLCAECGLYLRRARASRPPDPALRPQRHGDNDRHSRS